MVVPQQLVDLWTYVAWDLYLIGPRLLYKSTIGAKKNACKQRAAPWTYDWVHLSSPQTAVMTTDEYAKILAPSDPQIDAFSVPRISCPIFCCDDWWQMCELSPSGLTMVGDFISHAPRGHAQTDAMAWPPRLSWYSGRKQSIQSSMLILEQHGKYCLFQVLS